MVNVSKIAKYVSFIFEKPIVGCRFGRIINQSIKKVDKKADKWLLVSRSMLAHPTHSLLPHSRVWPGAVLSFIIFRFILTTAIQADRKRELEQCLKKKLVEKSGHR